MGSTKRRGRGEGHLELLPSSKWRAVICRTVNGERLRESKAFATKREALAWRAARLVAGPSPATTLGAWLDTWMPLHRGEVAESTYHCDEFVIRRHVRGPLGPVRLRDLTPLAVGRWLSALRDAGASRSARHMAGRSLRKAVNAAVRHGVLSVSPMRGAKLPPAPKPDTRSLDAAELGRVLGAAEKLGLGVMYQLWADSGVRPGELAGFVVGDFAPAAGSVVVRRSVCHVTGKIKETKTGRVRTIRLSPGTAGALRAHLRGRGSAEPMFPAPSGGHWEYQPFRRGAFNPVAAAAGVRFTPYTLRHTCATLLLSAGVNPKVVSERLGHADVAFTLRVYGHTMPDMQDAAVAAMGSILSGCVRSAG